MTPAGRFCEVSVPVPVYQSFTYSVPAQFEAKALAGCRVLVPFGARQLTGVILRTHGDPPEQAAREVLRVLDEQPVLEPDLMQLAHWIAEYYCAPLGEVIKSMLPLTGELRHKVQFSLTATGHDVTRQATLVAGDDPETKILELLIDRPRSVEYLTRKVRAAAAVLRKLVRDGLVAREEVHSERQARRATGGSRSSETVEGSPHTLNFDQWAAFDAIYAALEAKRFEAFLLHGVTGSGKTEVYLRAIDAALAMGRNALLLVPEIGLTPAVAGQFFQRFGAQVAILHSAVGDAERASEWRRIRSGEARVLVGTRSGVFAPVDNLGLVIVDEEHDASYKQQQSPRYNGRDVALMRAKQAGAVAVLGSATPSVETRYNADQRKYTLLRLPERIARRPLPQVEILDMRVEFLETKQHGMFSRKLIAEITERLAQREQTILLLNRRGFSNFMLCRACGERLPCANCSVVLTHHKRDRRMLCHYCGYAEKVPRECPKCSSDHIQFVGAGSERIEHELHERFPEARVARMDRDAVRAKGSFERILEAFREGDIDIIIGTQMIAKGHDVPNVTLVGVVLADVGLALPDFRAAERSFQLMTQAAGRAGRGSTPGKVIFQTYNPEHYAVRFAAAQDYDGFYAKEVEFRKWLRYPPFSAFANVIVRAPQKDDALRMSTQLGHLLFPPPEGVRVMGPAEAPVARVKNEFRYQILLKAGKRSVLRRTLRELQAFAEREEWNPTALLIDVDPISVM